MRKQTKLVAVLSATAVMALGASIMSYAAANWVNEDGVWVYYDKNGEAVTEEWKRSGSEWYWLNEDGEMATEALVENNDDYYYVDETGAMVTNKWIAIENEDYDGDDEDEPMNHWYYFGASGKAYKSSSTSNSASFKTIDGAKYIFDDEGKMLYGWIDEDGNRVTGDDDWKDGLYYCGDENDGAQKSGQWAHIKITDNNWETEAEWTSSPNVYDDEEQTRWFYFKTNGRKVTDEKGKTLETSTGSYKFSFDEWGRMNSDWVIYGATPSNASDMQGNREYTANWRYYGDPEDGARVSKGWFQVVPDEMLNQEDYDDDENVWFYSDKDGKLVAGELKTIDGEKYAFDGYGARKTGLRAIKFEQNENGTYSTKYIDEVKDGDDIPGLYFDTEDNFKENINDLLEAGYKIYYFGKDGKMATGKQTVTIDGEDFTFYFNKSGSSKGQGKFGVDDDKFYAGGMLMAADKDDKYSVVKTIKDSNGNYTHIQLLTTEEFLAEDEVEYSTVNPDEDDYEEYLTITKADQILTQIVDGEEKEFKLEYKVVNTSGKVQKDKSKVKDGDNRCYKVVKEKITAIYVED